MKKCKKIILLVIVVLLSMILKVYANESSEKSEVSLTLDKTSVKVGENVTIVVSASHENGIECIDSVLKYDETKLKLEKIQMKNDFLDQSETDAVTEEYIFKALFDGNENPTEVEYAELTFKVLEEVTVGEKLDIKLLNVYIIDTDLETVSVENEKITLTVIEELGKQEPEEKAPEKQETEQKPESNPDKLPQTGKTTQISVLVMCIVLSIIFYTRIRKYRGIK